MYLLRHIHDFRTVNSLVRCYGIAKRSHYEVLNLRKNCTDKEIKEAFIHMTKEYHPDKNKDANAQQIFVRIVEAYNVLSKPGSRAQYDHMMAYESSPAASYSSYRTYETYRYNPYSSHYNTHTYGKKNSKTDGTSDGQKVYYGATSRKKLPNSVIIMLCCGIAFLGTLLQVFLIRELYFVHRRQALERSRYLSEEYDKVRAASSGNGNELQTRLLLEKIVAAANTNVATASLGQALANEKKLSTEALLITEYGVSEAELADEDLSYDL